MTRGHRARAVHRLLDSHRIVHELRLAHDDGEEPGAGIARRVASGSADVAKRVKHGPDPAIVLGFLPLLQAPAVEVEREERLVVRGNGAQRTRQGLRHATSPGRFRARAHPVLLEPATPPGRGGSRGSSCGRAPSRRAVIPPRVRAVSSRARHSVRIFSHGMCVFSRTLACRAIDRPWMGRRREGGSPYAAAAGRGRPPAEHATSLRLAQGGQVMSRVQPRRSRTAEIHACSAMMGYRCSIRRSWLSS